MLRSWAKRSATASQRRRVGESDFRKRKEILEKEKKDRLRAAKERVAVKRREAQALLRPNDYAKKVQANNKVRIGNPKRYRRFDKYPDPRAKAERVQARREEQMLKQEAKKKQQKRRARPKSAAARPNDSARRTPRGPAASARLHGSSSMPGKNGSKPAAVNEWAMLYKFQNEQASVKEKESRKKRDEERAQWRKELLDAVNHKRSVKERSRKNDLKYKTIIDEDIKRWKIEAKKEKNARIKKYKSIGIERKRQLAERQRLQSLRDEEQKDIETEMMRRRERELREIELEKQRRRKWQAAELERIKVANEEVLERKARLRQEQFAYEAKLDAQWKEILDKQEMARKMQLVELYKKQHRMVKIAQSSTESTLEDKLAEDQRRAKHWQEVQERKEREAALAAEEKIRRSKLEMKKSIDAAVKRKALEKKRLLEEERRKALERNKIALEKLKLDDQKFLERKRRDKVYRHELAIQAHEDHVRKSVEKAAMDDVERQINQSMLDTVKDHYTKKGVWGKKNEPVNYRLSQVPL